MPIDRLSIRGPFLKHIVILMLLFLLPVPSPLFAQSEMAGWFLPAMGKAAPVFRVQATGYSARDVDGQQADWRATDSRVLFSTPVRQSETSEWSVAARLEEMDIKTDAILPNGRIPFPNTLWDTEFGSFYRQRFENGWIGGVAASVGSASDKPFNTLDETSLRATIFTRVPDGERNAWLFLLNYSSDRDFLRNVPLPGVGYWYQPSSRFLAVIGLPFLFLEARPVDAVSLELAYFAIRRIHAGVTYRLLPSLKALGSFDWRSTSYSRADRADKDSRLFFYEKRLSLGCQWQVEEHVTIELAGGYAFDLMVFEGEDYRDRDLNRIDIADGPFVSGQAAIHF